MIPKTSPTYALLQTRLRELDEETRELRRILGTTTKVIARSSAWTPERRAKVSRQMKRKWAERKKAARKA